LSLFEINTQAVMKASRYGVTTQDLQ